MALPLLISLLADPGMAKPQDPSPTSSASITISVSVAPRYALAVKQSSFQLQAMERASGGSLCIATNGSGLTLPVMLTWSEADDGQSGTVTAQAMKLEPCNVPAGKGFDGHVLDELASGELVIVRPE